MIDRKTVLALLGVANCEHQTISLESAELAELCRVYLAWLDAPVGTVYINDYGATEVAGVHGVTDGTMVQLVEVK